MQEAYIDAFAMWLMRNPEEHDVVVLPNMFGDIATDLASVLQEASAWPPTRTWASTT